MLVTRSAAIFSALLFFAATLSPVTAFGDGRAQTWKEELPIRQPWLREHLPDDALIYFRIPHFLGLLATPKGDSLDAALRSRSNVENLVKIKQGIAENVLEQIPLFADPRIRLFEKHLRSPLEVAAFMTPAPSALVALNLDLASNDALYEVFEMFALISPNFTLAGPLDDQGYSQINGTPVPLFLNFDAASGRMLLNGGPAVTRESFAAMVESVAAGNNHRMASMEQDIDQSGQGLFFWIDAGQALPAMRTFMQPSQVTELNNLGLDRVRAAAIGWGVSDHKGRLAIVADVPTDTGRDLLPYVNNKLSARSVGDPDGLILLSIPAATDFARIETLSLQSASVEARTSWVRGKAVFRDITGVTIEELLAAVGPELMVIFDAAGDYAAWRVRDRELWDDLLSRIAEKVGNKPDEKRIAGKTYYHWSMPGQFDWMENDATTGNDWLQSLLLKQRDHLYWTIDDDGFLYTASVPQILIERAAKGAKTDIGQWLTDVQRIDASHAVLSLTGTNRKLPKRFYAVYIEIMQFLADIAETEIDVWSMPTADQLRLPENGAIGLTVKFGDPNLAIELMFENNPLEALISGGGSSIAIAGILAAIAIPAYQDYEIRAKVSEGLSLAAAKKIAVTEYYSANGRFPGEAESSQMSTSVGAGKFVRSVLVEPDSGTIVISYKEDALPDGGDLYLQPSVDANGTMSWSCGSNTIADKHLPAACRD
jgi:Tfp pilus assembly protein PilE